MPEREASPVNNHYGCQQIIKSLQRVKNTEPDAKYHKETSGILCHIVAGFRDFLNFCVDVLEKHEK